MSIGMWKAVVYSFFVIAGLCGMALLGFAVASGESGNWPYAVFGVMLLGSFFLALYGFVTTKQKNM